MPNWKYQEESDIYTHIVRDEDGNMICHLGQDSSGEAEANARLISASPEMLEHLIWVQKALNEGEDPDLIIAETANMIAKAKGE